MEQEKGKKEKKQSLEELKKEAAELNAVNRCGVCKRQLPPRHYTLYLEEQKVHVCPNCKKVFNQLKQEGKVE